MKISAPAACGCLLLLGGAARADELGVTFDHASETDLTRTLKPAAGDRITATITHTCPTQFLYAWTALARSVPTDTQNDLIASNQACSVDQAKKVLVAKGFCEFKDQELKFVHAADTGGYLIEVTKQDTAPKEVRGLTTEEFDAAAKDMANGGTCEVPKELEKKTKELKKTRYYVSINESPWAIGMSGGVSISSVVDPRFAIVNDPASSTTPPGTMVIHDKGADDRQKLGFAGYLHVHHENFRLGRLPLAATFGLGMDDKSSINTMIGISAAASNLAYVTLGWNWAAVDHLPAGQELGKAPMNENVLNNSPKHTKSGWFLGVSFKFMSPGDAFFKGKAVPKVEKSDPGGAQ